MMIQAGVVGVGCIAVAAQMSVYYLKVQQIFPCDIMCTMHYALIVTCMRSQRYHLFTDSEHSIKVLSMNQSVDCPGVQEDILYTQGVEGHFMLM